MCRLAATHGGFLGLAFILAAEPGHDISAMLLAFVLAFGSLVATGFGVVPLPEELPIVLSGIWVGQNPELGPARWLILPVCITGVVISDGLLYGMGRFFGTRLLENRWVQRVLPPQKRQRIQQNFQRYGVLTLLFARFLPAIRSPIFVTAGIMRLSLTRFLLADGLYAIPGVSLLFFLSWWFGDQFKELVERAEARVGQIRPLLILLAIAALAGILTYHFLRRPLAMGDPAELPLIGEKFAAKMESSKNWTAVPPSSQDSDSKPDGDSPHPTLSPEGRGQGEGALKAGGDRLEID